MSELNVEEYHHKLVLYTNLLRTDLPYQAETITLLRDVREVTMRGVCLYTIKPGNPGSFRKLHTLANSMYEQIQKRNKQKKHKRVKKMFYNCSGSITKRRLRIDQPGIKCDFYFTGTAKFGFLIIKLPIAF